MISTAILAATMNCSRSLLTNYAHRRLAGLTVVNSSTQLAVTLTDDGLKAATKRGTPANLLRAIPALPAMLSHARYIGTFADPQERRDVRRLHVFDSDVAIASQPAFEVRLVARENFKSQCFFDRMLKGRATRRRRDAGGWVPESTTPDLTAGADSPVLADAEAGFDPGKFVSVDSSQNSDDECWRKCGHLLPSPSGDLQASEFRRCWRLCKGGLHE